MAASLSHRVFAASVLAALVRAGAAADASCYALVGAGSWRPASAAPVTCAAQSDREADFCFLLCGLCTTPELAMGLDPSVAAQYCSGGPTPDNATVVQLATSAFMNASAAQGYFWLDDAGDVEANATACVSYLFSFMPRRDMQLLFAQPFEMMDFVVEHVRYAERAWFYFTSHYGVPWQVFLDAVLPWQVFDEKRDLSWRWRPRFAQLFGGAVAGAANLTAAMYALAAAIPAADPLGALAVNNANGTAVVPGPPISWHSEVSPAYLSPQQVSTWGGSCTGTGIVLVAAARAVGIPARLAGCSQSIPDDDTTGASISTPARPGHLATAGTQRRA
jgi:hypothetical protein